MLNHISQCTDKIEIRWMPAVTSARNSRHSSHQYWKLVILVALSAIMGLNACNNRMTLAVPSPQVHVGIHTALPPPRTVGKLSFEEVLQQRRSIRQFSDQPLSEQEISQLLWAAQGVTNPQGYRTAPSAGALYPLELYAVTQTGIYHYDPPAHTLTVVREGDVRQALYEAALNQEAVLKAPLVVVITAVYERTESKYGDERGPRYVQLEAGHAAQNLLLQAVALGLGAVPIGAFRDEQVQAALNLPSEHMPLYLIPVGSLP
jgi:SagB-type dehydrogenase family enzyme